MSNVEDIEILCKHLAEKLDIEIRFEEGSPPCTDGKKIVLPTDLNRKVMLELLATLLHETGHIRSTDMDKFTQICENNGSLYKLAVNMLEDVRVDNETLKKYPQARELYYLLFRYCFDKQTENLKAEGLPIQVMKHMMVRSYEIDKKLSDTLVYNPTAIDIINQLNLDGFTNRAKQCSSIFQVEQVARDLLTVLTNFFRDVFKEEIQKKQEQNQARTQEQKDAEAEERESTPYYNGSYRYAGNFNPNQEDLDKPIPEGLKEKVKKEYGYEDILKDQKEIKKKRETEYNEAQTKNHEAQRQENLDRDAKKSLERGLTRIDGNVREKETLLRRGGLSRAEEEKAEKSKEKSEEKSELYHEQIAELEDKIEKDRALSEKTGEIREKAARKYGEEYNRLKAMMEDPNSTDALFGKDNRVDLNGFSAIDSGDVMGSNLYDSTDILVTKSLDEKIRDTFLGKKEERMPEETGRVNHRVLYRVMTGDDNIFQEDEETHKKTHIIFLLDASGSMGGSKATMLVTAVDSLLNALKRVIENEDLPISIGVYDFDDNVRQIKHFDDPLKEFLLKDTYYTRGSTRLLQSVLKMADIFHNIGEDSEKILVIATDAEVDSNEIHRLSNQTFDDIRTIYIGLGVNDRSECVKKLFRNNIETEKQILEVLTDVVTK